MRKALLIIDVQNEYFTGRLPVTYPAPEESLAHMLELMRRAQALQMPIIVIQHTAQTGETFAVMAGSFIRRSQKCRMMII